MRLGIVLGVVTACGATEPAPRPIANVAPPPKPLDVPEWAGVTEGAEFRLHDGDNGEIVARVTRVVKQPAKWTIELAWSPGLYKHETVEITADEVSFVDRQRRYPRDGARPDSPDIKGAALKDDHGGVCYVFNDAPPPMECGDVCVGEFCLDPKLGIVGGYGMDWPHRNRFRR
jgi:hypothetical protein